MICVEDVEDVKTEYKRVENKSYDIGFEKKNVPK